MHTVFTSRTTSPNFTPIRFETTEPWAWALFEEVAPTTAKSSDMGSVSDPKKLDGLLWYLLAYSVKEIFQ